jgi:vesicle coat complex subunit
MANRPPGQSPAPQGGAGYFDNKKGEVNELKALLRNINVERDAKRKREVIKKVIAYMTLGIDVSRLFTEMVMAVDTTDLVVKKMVFLYLTNYAASNPELAILCINTLLTDCRNEDPLIRGLALRHLCSLKLESVAEYIQEPLLNSLRDNSPYVRKTGVMGVLKLHDLNAELVRDSDLIDQLYNMIRDQDCQVVANCVHALNEIMIDEGGMGINSKIVQHLLNRILEFNEWGQCCILQLLSRYKPEAQEETFSIMNLLEQCLRVSNSAVVIAATKCFLFLTENLPEIQFQVYQRLKTPLLTLMAGSTSEITYCVLHHTSILVKRCPGVFDDEYRQFYTRFNEPTSVKFIKVDIMSLVANEQNMQELVAELSEYVTDVNAEMSRRAIRSIANIASRIPTGASNIIDTLIEFLDMDIDWVRSQTITVLKNLLRLYPEHNHDVMPHLKTCLRRLDDEEGKCAVVWIIGEFGHELRDAPYILEPLIDEVGEHEQNSTVVMELLTATMKLFFKRPGEVQAMLGRLLQSAIDETGDADMHDRALLYYRLLEHDVKIAEQILTSKVDKVGAFAEEVETELQEKLFAEFNTLAVVYGKPSEQFISGA